MPYLETDYLNRWDAPYLLPVSINALVTACLRMKTSGTIQEQPRTHMYTQLAQFIETKDVTRHALRCTSQQPFGDDVSTLYPLRSSVSSSWR